MKLAALLAVLALAGCSSKKREAEPEPATPEAVVPEVGTPEPAAIRAPTVAAPKVAPALPRDFPTECVAYAELIGKLAACDAMEGARTTMVAAYEELRAAWPAVPAAQRGSVVEQCKTQAESLRGAAAATCHW